MEQTAPTLAELQTLIEMTGTINMEVFYWWCTGLMVIIMRDSLRMRWVHRV